MAYVSNKRLTRAIAGLLETYSYEEIIDHLAEAADEDDYDELVVALNNAAKIAEKIDNDDDDDDEEDNSEEDSEEDDDVEEET